MVLDQYFLSLFCVQYVTHCIVLDNCFCFFLEVKKMYLNNT